MIIELEILVDLSKLSDDNIDASRFVLKTKNDTDKSELENKIPDTGGLIIMPKSLI